MDKKEITWCYFFLEPEKKILVTDACVGIDF